MENVTTKGSAIKRPTGRWKKGIQGKKDHPISPSREGADGSYYLER